MNKILVEVSVGELLDKISILEIKKEKIKDTNKLKFINLEYSILKDQFNKNKEQLRMYGPISKVIGNSGTTITENWNKV